MIPDIINALFELGGALVLARNCWILFKDKEVKGWHWHSVAFFGLWGLWNLFYYPHLYQWYSFVGGLLLVGVNLTWLCQVWYYHHWYLNGVKWQKRPFGEDGKIPWEN